MSWTEGSPAGEKLLRRFFSEQIVPTAARLAERGVEYFPKGPDPKATSYFQRHDPADSELVEIEVSTGPEQLKARWLREGYPELAELAGPLFAMAPQLVPPVEESGDVSPFIYVMF